MSCRRARSSGGTSRSCESITGSRTSSFFPASIAAIGVDWSGVGQGLWRRFPLGMASVCLVASSNYVINEVLDAPSDRSHPVKRNRPVPSGQVSVPLAYVQWIALMVVGVGLGLQVSTPFAIVVFSPVGDGLHLQHPPDPQQGPALRRRAVGGGQQPAAHARRLVHRLDCVVRAGVAAPELLDGRLLLHGDEALRGIPRNR